MFKKILKFLLFIIILSVIVNNCDCGDCGCGDDGCGCDEEESYSSSYYNGNNNWNNDNWNNNNNGYWNNGGYSSSSSYYNPNYSSSEDDYSYENDSESDYYESSSEESSSSEEVVVEPTLLYEFIEAENAYRVIGVEMEGATTSAVIIPESYEGAPVTEIAPMAFKDMGVFSVTIPDSVTKIGAEAFSGSSIREAVIPRNVTEIATQAFYNCWNLQSVTLPSGLTSIGDEAFYNCTELRAIDIPDSVLTVGKNVFDQCNYFLESEAGIGYVDGWAVSADTSMTTASLREGTVGICNELFGGCTQLENVTIVASVEVIGAKAFFGCDMLARAYFADVSNWIAGDMEIWDEVLRDECEAAIYLNFYYVENSWYKGQSI